MKTESNSGVKSPQAIRPEIYDYQNYRDFLRALLEREIAEGRQKSVRSFAEAAGISASHYCDIINGRRRMTKKILDRIIPQLKISKLESRILKLLIVLSDSLSQVDKAQAFQKICRSGLYRSKHRDAIAAGEYIKKWHYVAIREMADLPQFSDDPKWIRARLKYKVTLNQIRDALQFLKKNNLVRLDENGRISGTNQLLRCDGDIYKLSLAEMHNQFLKLAIQSIYRVHSEKRHLTNFTLSLPEKEFAQVKDVLDQAISKIQSISESVGEYRSADTVYHISFHAFPLATVKKGDAA